MCSAMTKIVIMGKRIVAGLGEILWDLLPEGKQLGGAPANFAWHAQQLGALGVVVSAVGEDEYGKEILDLIRERELGEGIAVTSHPTGTVEVKLEKGIPDYIIHENVAWDFIELNETAVEALSNADAVCFGSLAQRSEISRRNIHRALGMTPDDCIKVFDINLRQHFYSKEVITKSLQHANVFKINDEELIELKNMLELEGDDESVCQTLLKCYDLQMVALTGGDKSSMLINGHEVSEMKTPRVEVADTIGAGDSFTAAMVMGMLNGLSLKEIHQKALEISAFVCTRNGAMPVLPEKIVM